MFYQTEAKPQCWRAVAVFDDRPEQLLYLNRSSTQVRAGFRDSYFELLDDEERDHVKNVSSCSVGRGLRIQVAGFINQIWPSPFSRSWFKALNY